MSTSYYVYTEVKINGKWIGIDPQYPKLNNIEKDYKKPDKYDGSYQYQHNETYWNGSRSYFGQTFDRLEQIGHLVKFSEMSDEVQQHWQRALMDELNNEQYQCCTAVQVDFDTFKNSFNPKAFELHGLIHKDIWFAYQNGDIEDIYNVEHQEFKSLTKGERQCYEYHEWDDSMGWNTYFKVLLEKISQRIADFEDINGFWGDKMLQYRLIVIRS